MAIFRVFFLTLGAVCTLGQPVSHILRNGIRPGNTQTGQNQNSGAGPSSSTSGQSGQGVSMSAVPAFCSDNEKMTLFRSCIFPYVQEHRGYIQYLSRQRACQAEVFSCSRTDQLVQCLNTLPISKVSNQCWPMVPGLFGNLLKLYRVPCTFDDVKKQCRDTVQDLATVQKRSQQALGLNGSPQQGVGLNLATQQGVGLSNGPQQGGGLRPADQQGGGSNNSPQSGGGRTISLQDALSGGSSPSVNQTTQSNESAAALGLTPYCSSTEKSTVFRSCARSYGFSHYRMFIYLRNQPTCRAERFSCQRTDQLMGCINRMPVQQVSNNCWIMMPDVLTSFFKRYNLPCTFDDIKKQCSNVSQPLLAVAKRVGQQPTGMSRSPQQPGGFNQTPQRNGMMNGFSQQAGTMNRMPQQGGVWNRMPRQRQQQRQSFGFVFG